MPNDVVDKFLGRAAMTPESPAIITSREVVSYRQFEHRARAFAAAFSNREAPRVLIALPPGVDVYASIFAAGLVGGFHTPVNMASPLAKMRLIVEQLQPDVVVSNPDLLSHLRQMMPRTATIEDRA